MLMKFGVKLFTYDVRSVPLLSKKVQSNTNRLVLGALLTSIAVIFQSLGALGGIGYAFSMLSTMPIFLAAMVSARIGMLSYLVSILLLLLLQPSELFVFPFTTGILGLSMGLSLRICKKTFLVPIISALSLGLGIFILIELLHFPILGPEVASVFKFPTLALLVAGSLLYSWMWTKLSLRILKHVVHAVVTEKVTETDSSR